MARPRTEIDWVTVKKLCGIQCTRSEIASFLDVSDSTLVRHCHTDHGCDFDTLYKKWSENGKTSIRRMQFKLAEKNAALCIWLGKQYLGQKDQQDIEVQAKVEKAFDPSKLSKEEYKEFIASQMAALKSGK